MKPSWKGHGSPRSFCLAPLRVDAQNDGQSRRLAWARGGAARRIQRRPSYLLERLKRIAPAAPQGGRAASGKTTKGSAMILGLSTSAFTTVHVVLSLIGILAGIVVLFNLIGARWVGGWNALFLVTTIATSVTGFFFPFTQFLPSHAVGLISLAALAAALFALYGRRLAGLWRPAYIVIAVLALYLNVFVAVVQAFQKLPFLQAFAPTQSEPPFLAAQLIVLIAFIALGALAIKRFHPPRTGRMEPIQS
jgi:hypothetical protein